MNNSISCHFLSSKTGTLTADTQSLSKVVSSFHSHGVTEEFQRCLLAGCHSLVRLIDTDTGKRSFVGDPLDDAALTFSGWKYNQTNESFFLPQEKTKILNSTEPVRLWQIRTFPFDPSRRVSTAVVLLQRKDATLELWRFAKGAPDTLKRSLKDRTGDSFSTFEKQKAGLEKNGYRVIAMGAEDLTNSSLCETLFPDGLSVSTKSLIFARLQGRHLHRDAIERLESRSRDLISCGFSCFDAALRCSSRRIVQELKNAGLACIMLTGDSLDAALNVAIRADILSARRVATLELSESLNDQSVIWKIRDSDNSTPEHQSDKSNAHGLTVKSVRRLLKRHATGKISLLASGEALEYVFNNPRNDTHRIITRNLGSISVIARATPEMKKKIVEALKRDCGKTVLMCGTFQMQPVLLSLFDLQFLKEQTGSME
jgi:magnesium-transporting ATPase (P-type)